MSPGALRVEIAKVSVGGRELIRDLSFQVEPGEVTTVMGPSGSGKSTLLAFIGGHLDHAFQASGKVFLGARDVTGLAPEHRGIGLLFQDDLLFPHLSVAFNVAFGLDPSVRGRAARRTRVVQVLTEAGLAGFEDRDPATLSGGQRARVALARSLVAAPKALLLDEPFNKLDAELRNEFRRYVFDAAVVAGLPVVLVTHDPDDTAAAGGAVLRLAGP